MNKAMLGSVQQLGGQSLNKQLVFARSKRANLSVRAQEAKPKPKAEQKPFTPPTLDPNTPSPIFGGSTGGLLRKAQFEEFYVITWDSPKEQNFEMPTAGTAQMRQGPNLLKLARKEQCLYLTNYLRGSFKINAQFYRVFPNGEVQYLHPKDGVVPAKVNKGRKAVGTEDRRIGQNPNPGAVKFLGKEGRVNTPEEGFGF